MSLEGAASMSCLGTAISRLTPITHFFLMNSWDRHMRFLLSLESVHSAGSRLVYVGSLSFLLLVGVGMMGHGWHC